MKAEGGEAESGEAVATMLMLTNTIMLRDEASGVLRRHHGKPILRKLRMTR